MDKGGARTIDSVLYAQSQGLMDDWLIVSQAFHNQRSLMLARHFKVQAHAYNAKDVEGGWRVHVRERFARVRLAWDMLTGRLSVAGGQSLNADEISAKNVASDEQVTESTQKNIEHSGKSGVE